MSNPEIKPDPDKDMSSDEEMYNPCKLPGDNVWEPDPKIIVELYERLDKDGVLELNWKSPGRMPIQELTTPQKPVDVIKDTSEEDLKIMQKQNMLSMFDADDFSHQGPAPNSLTKTPARTPKNTPKAKASFDKIFNRVSLQAGEEVKTTGEGDT